MNSNPKPLETKWRESNLINSNHISVMCLVWLNSLKG